jgi:hypothetical protein
MNNRAECSFNPGPSKVTRGSGQVRGLWNAVDFDRRGSRQANCRGVRLRRVIALVGARGAFPMGVLAIALEHQARPRARCRCQLSPDKTFGELAAWDMSAIAPAGAALRL